MEGSSDICGKKNLERGRKERNWRKHRREDGTCHMPRESHSPRAAPTVFPRRVAGGALRGPQHRAQALVRHRSDWAAKAPWLPVPWLTRCGRRRRRV